MKPEKTGPTGRPAASQGNSHARLSDAAAAPLALIGTHIARYPLMELSDVYRLLHQGTFGVGHPIPNRKAAREWLEHEAHTAQPNAAEALIESIHPAGAIVRLHLRPFLARGGRLGPLLEAYIRSAEQIQGDPAQMAAWWAGFEAAIAPGGALAGRFDPRVAGLLRRANQAGGWPMLHHSPTYIQRYRPLYRILSVEAASALCTEQGFAFSVL